MTEHEGQVIEERPLPLMAGSGWQIWQRGWEMLRIVSGEYPDDALLLMLPECVLDDDAGYFLWGGQRDSAAGWHAHGANRAIRVAALEGAAEYQTCLTCYPGVLSLHLSIRNLSPQTWHQAAGVVCLRLSGAPTFADGNLERTYIRSGGEFVRLADTDRSYGNPNFNAYLCGGLTPPPAWAKPEALWTARRESPDDGFIATIARDGSGVAAVLWEPAHDVGCNVSEDFRCIHSNPLVGDLEGGRTTTCRGCIAVLKGGDIEDAYQRCHTAIAEPHHD
jgi:hypothetical protein